MSLIPAPTRAEELGRQIATIVEKVDSIAEGAKTAGRSMTAAERTEVEGLLAEGSRLRSERKTAQTEDALRDSLNVDLGLGAHHGLRQSLARPSAWGKAMRDHLTHVGAKDLTPSGAITAPSLDETIPQNPDRPTSVLQAVPWSPVDTGLVSYIREVARDHNAGTVAPGHLKPRSNYELERIDDRARVIAHITDPVDNSLLADAPMVSSYLDDVLRVGLELELERLVLNGDGDTTGGRDNFTGLLQVSGHASQAFATDVWTTTRKAVTRAENTNLDQRGFRWVMSPEAWETLELDTTTEAFTLNGGAAGNGDRLPIDRAARRLWGVPVITSTSMAEVGDETALLGDLAGSCRVRMREQVRIEWSEAVQVALPGDSASMSASAFETNQKVFRAEMRATLEIFRPAAFIEVALAS